MGYRKVGYCQLCGKEFIEDRPSHYSKRKFCSHSCRNKYYSKEKSFNWRGGKVKKECLVCGKNFKINLYNSKYRKTCSRKCMGTYMSKNRIGKNNGNWKGGLIETICLTCGKELFVFPSRIGRKKFCSDRCKGIHNFQHMKKKDTKIEIAIEQELIKNKISYKKQVPVEGIALVDFLLSDKIIIQTDGDYWHNLQDHKNRDINQDIVLTFKGYKVYRFWEKDIKKSALKCLRRIKKLCL